MLQLVCLFVICDSGISWSKLFYCYGLRETRFSCTILVVFISFFISFILPFHGLPQRRKENNEKIVIFFYNRNSHFVLMTKHVNKITKNHKFYFGTFVWRIWKKEINSTKKPIQWVREVLHDNLFSLFFGIKWSVLILLNFSFAVFFAFCRHSLARHYY